MSDDDRSDDVEKHRSMPWGGVLAEKSDCDSKSSLSLPS